MTITNFDIIGDIHGCYRELRLLLSKLGYADNGRSWCHARRKAVFVGDILDRGPQVRECYWLVRNMVDSGNAYMVLGNHEINAIAMNTRVVSSGASQYVRARSEHHLQQTKETYQAFADYPAEWYSLIGWLLKQPLYLELGDFRVVHACWCNKSIEYIEQHYQNDLLALISASIDPRGKERRCLDVLTRGTDMKLPNNQTIRSRDGIVRSYFRTKFWVEDAHTYGELEFQPDPLPKAVASMPISERNRQRQVNYPANDPALFVGHYWLSEPAKLLTNNIACVDYSAVKGGNLVAYKHQLQQPLAVENFVAVAAVNSTYTTR